MKKLKLQKKKNRIWELDLLKGIALIFMVWDHIVFDLDSLFGYDVSSLGFFKEGIGVISSIIFMTVCGVSITLGRHNIRHGAITFSLAMALSAFTFVFDKITDSGTIILFGILHFLGLAMILGHFLKRLPLPVLCVLGVSAYALGVFFTEKTVALPFLFPLGLVRNDFYSSDYFPLFPNLAYIIAGIIIGRTVYKKKKSLFHFEPRKSLLCFLGRHTLLLYFVHQPLIYGILMIISYAKG